MQYKIYGTIPFGRQYLSGVKDTLEEAKDRVTLLMEQGHGPTRIEEMDEPRRRDPRLRAAEMFPPRACH